MQNYAILYINKDINESFNKGLVTRQVILVHNVQICWGLAHYPRTFPPEKNANNVAKIEARLMKQYLSSRTRINETILS